MAIATLGQRQYLQALERSLRIIRNTDHLSLEASIEELCKIQMMLMYLEQKNESTLLDFIHNLKSNTEEVKVFYERYFRMYVPVSSFVGWDKLYAGKTSFVKVIEELSDSGIFGCEQQDKALAFSEFLQMHYAGYLSEYSTPNILSMFIDSVLDTENLMSFADPCCGLGGLLVEAVKNKGNHIKVKGFDVNQRMVNTANLQLMIYGYKETVVGCQDILGTAVAFMDGPYEAVVSHLPVRHRAFSIAGRRGDGIDKMFSRIQEDIIISQILKMLKPNGIAALVVSDELLLTERRADSRRWLYQNAQILNITRLEGISYNGSSNKRAYNVVILRKQNYPTSDVCMATLIKDGTSEEEIREIAQNIKKNIYKNRNLKDYQSQYFRLMEEDVWNVNLLFAKEKMGFRYPTVFLKDLVISDRERARVIDDRYYKQLTVKIKGLGVVERETEYMGTSSSNNVRYVAHGGQIIMSSLEADKGAVGIVPKGLNQALVSRNYYLFTITSDNIDPDYLAMVLSSEPVLRQLRQHKRGYIMSRISIEKILSLVIPLPSLEEQRMLVGKLMRKVKRAMQIQDELEMERKDFALKLFGEE